MFGHLLLGKRIVRDHVGELVQARLAPQRFQRMMHREFYEAEALKPHRVRPVAATPQVVDSAHSGVIPPVRVLGYQEQQL